MVTPMGTAIYTRQSKDKTGLEAGVERQLKECKAKAGPDLTIDYELSDNDISATTGKVRPDFEKLLDLIKRDLVDTVIVWHTDRLYRNLRTLVRITDLTEKHPVKIITVKAGELNLNTATGRMLAGILGSVSSQEGEHRRDRQISAFRAYAEAGVWGFSHRPFGYTRTPSTKVNGKTVPGVVTVVEDEAVVIREMFAKYYAGASYYSLVSDLNERGIPTVKGNTWTITQLRSVLSNPRYAGINLYLGEEVGAGSWQPIISREEWAKYKGVAAPRQINHFSRTATSLLSGVMVCAVCEGKLYRVQRGNSERGDYMCILRHVSTSMRIAETKVKAAVVSALLFAPSDLVTDDGGVDLVGLTEAANSLQSRADDLVALIGEGLSTMAKVRPQLLDLKERRAALVARRDDLVRTSAVAGVLAGMRAEIFAGSRVKFSDAARAKREIAESFDRQPLARQRELVKLLVSVTVGTGRGADRIDVFHKVVTSLNEETAA